MAEAIGKRTLDLVLLAISSPIVIPAIIMVGTLVRLRLGSPVLFVQERPGLHGKIFRMLKFRSMTDERDEHGLLRPDAQRLTKFGQFLRETSLDELPELWNVLVGDMSLVGPRPLLPEYLALYSPEQNRRHRVRPGVTGWAQVNGRNALSWEEKFRLDVWYVDHRSLWLDLKIVVMTVLRVFKRHGISAPGDATMPRFTGSTEN